MSQIVKESPRPGGDGQRRARIVLHPHHRALLELRTESGEVVETLVFAPDARGNLDRAILRLREIGRARGFVVVDWPGRVSGT